MRQGRWADPGLRGGLAEAGAGSGDGESLFKGQWALDSESGIGLYDESGNRIQRGDGEGVLVGIFDTSPFGGAGEETVGALTLRVSHPPLRPAPGCPGIGMYEEEPPESPDIRNHGLFVAGLVHEVAPASEIHLVRVLEDDGCGSLYSIAGAVQAFVVQALDEGAEDIVVNLSLGVHQPRDPERFGLATRRELKEEGRQPDGVQVLEDILRWADEQGAVIVAAAGNDSFADLAAPRGMEMPAAYDFVIGVAASNKDRARGCFSNTAPGAPNVAAPGGDGVPPAEGVSPSWPCNVPEKCSDEHHEACLVSLSLDSDTGYVYWVGTSFAAPLVTGQVAVMLGSGGGVPIDTCPSADPGQLGEIGYIGNGCPP
jgi:subtilisin family serine protease